MSKSRTHQQLYVDGPPFRDIDLDWWDELEQHPQAKRRLFTGEFRVGVAFYNLASGRRLDRDVISWMHRTVFGEVFPELAGVFRSAEQLPAKVTFGRFSGTPYPAVRDELNALERDLSSILAQLDELEQAGDTANLQEGVLQAASYVHCEVIRIHPFVNGNGRVSRLCINYVCQRYGYLPIPIERPKGDYLEASRTWLDRRRIEHFVDFLRPLLLHPPELVIP